MSDPPDPSIPADDDGSSSSSSSSSLSSSPSASSLSSSSSSLPSSSSSSTLRRDSTGSWLLDYLVPKPVQDWFTPRETLEARRKEEEKERTRREWDIEWRLLNPEEQRQVVEVLELEDAYLLHGTDEAKKLAAMENNFATGFLLRYKVLTEASGKSLKQEAAGNQFGKVISKAETIVAEAKAAKPIYQTTEFDQDYLLALSLYTSNTGYQILNYLLRNRKFKDPLKYTIFAADFIKGFRVLPSFWGTVYRGMTLDHKAWTEGQVVLFEGFTSCSKEEDRAKEFIRLSFNDEKNTLPRVLLIIHKSKSGRCLEDLSFFKNEKEVVFRPFTSFKVGKKTKKWVKNDPKVNKSYYYWEIEMEEAYPDTRGRKVLLWVDDDHGADSKKIMDQSEKLGVTCVHLTSTKHAKEFLKTHDNLLQRNIEQLRIISDMHRMEDGKSVPDAGFQLVQFLVKEKKYPEKIMIFTGVKNLPEKKEKFRAAGLDKQVDIQVTMSACLQFASFELKIESKYPSAPSSPSHASSPTSPSTSSDSFLLTTTATLSSSSSSSSSISVSSET